MFIINYIFIQSINMDDIVDEKYEWQMFGEEEIFCLERSEINEGDIDLRLMEELLAIDCGDAPPPPAYPMVVEIDGKQT